jgi:translation initiation factor IF-3
MSQNDRDVAVLTHNAEILTAKVMHKGKIRYVSEKKARERAR